MAKSKANKTGKKPAAKKGQAAYGIRKPGKRYVSPKIELGALAPTFSRADLVFHGLDHAGASYEGRVFLNNPNANEKTPPTARNGYAGSYHIFGHGGCFGDVGHCDVLGLPRPYDPRPAHPLTPARKTLIATDAIRQALKRGKQVTVTVVPIVTPGPARAEHQNVVKFDHISVVTYG